MSDQPSTQPVQDTPILPPNQGMKLPEDVPALQNLVRSLAARLMSHSQTVQELLRANMDMKAALHTTEQYKNQLEAYIKSLLAPQAPAKPEDAPKEGDQASDASATAPVEGAADANSVQP